MRPNLVNFMMVGIGGFLGSCLRYAFTKLFAWFQLAFPYGTLLSNVLAGIVIGLILGLEQQTVVIPPRTRLFLTTGLLGGLSTFSTFSAETILMLQDGKVLLAAGNVALNLGLSLIGVAAGILLVKAVRTRISL